MITPMNSHLVTPDFIIPESFQDKLFKLEVLAPALAELDYEAVMSCKSRLRTVFGLETEWPRDDLTLADNMQDLIMHEQEFKTRKAFAYSILTCAGERVLGTVYIDPSRVAKFDCEVQFWLRDDSLEVDANVYESISKWLSNCWSFDNIAFPGRNISWQEWNLLLEASGYVYDEADHQQRRENASKK